MTLEIKPGSEVLIKRAKQGRFQFYGYEYTSAVVSRVTKARVFIRTCLANSPDFREREFNRADLSERDATYNKAQLVVDAEEIAAARAEEAAALARRKLERSGLDAIARLAQQFDRDRIHLRTSEEIDAMIAAVSKLLAVEVSS